jgi:uncharacterized protein YbaR (Trm112 family)
LQGKFMADNPPNKPNEQPDPRLLELLVCPLTKTRLSYDRVNDELVSKAAALAFPIRNGVPLMRRLGEFSQDSENYYIARP